MLTIILGIVISYLVGSIPTAYLFGWLLKGIDIRRFGSGNVGATNALRVLGKGPGIAVLVLDTLKGLFSVVVFGNILINSSSLISEEALRILLGLSCIAGHNWTIFLKFKGGKGIATSLGVLLGLMVNIAALKSILILLVLTWLIVFIFFRIVSLSSVITALSLPVYVVLFRQSNSLIFTSFLLSLLTILRHIPNLKRLIQGKETRLF